VTRVYANRASAPSLDDSGPLIGTTFAYDLGYTGAGQTVAILDTGVDSAHPFLAGKVVAEACYSTSLGSEVEGMCPGPDPTTAVGPGTGGPCPLGSKCDHGTHVAGIAAGNGASFSGVAKDATIISVQVFSKFNSACDPEAPPCVRVMDFDVIRGLDFVYGLRSTYSIASVNLSLGGFPIPGYCDFDSRKPAIDALRAVGIGTAVAAGNDAVKTGIQLPACISSAISVGATTKADTVAGFSDSAPHLSLLAPGVGITSSVPGGGFASFSGTSMATPHVTGALAVLKQRWPGLAIPDAVGILRGTGLAVRDAGNDLAVPRVRLDAALEPPTFHPVTPSRLLDTRDGTGVAGAAVAPVGPGQTIDLTVTGRGGVPASNVSAVVVNVTGVGPTAGTHLTVWPARFPKPQTSNLNLRPGETRANLMVVRVGSEGRISIANFAGASHVVVDVFGWWDTGGSNDDGLHYLPRWLPTRIIDTRDGTGTSGPGPIGPGGTMTFDALAACPAPGATAVALNVTATGVTEPSHFSVFPAGTVPGTSNLNLVPGVDIPNGVIVGTSSGSVSIRNNAGSAHAVVDLAGCFYPSPPDVGSGRFVPADPVRLLDTRNGLGSPTAGPLVGPGAIGVQVTGRGGVPATGVAAAVVNVTVTGGDGPNHLTVAPSGITLAELLEVANTSVLNYSLGQDVANGVVATLGPNGQFIVGQFSGSVHVIVDLVGWITA
jgi:hypothetical protein